MRRLARVVLGFLLAIGPAHAETALEWTAEEVRAVAAHGPWPPAPPRDPSNRVSGNPAAVALGRALFDEPRLSASRQISCGDCHQAGRDWRDGRARAVGRVELDRRTPSLWNVGYQHWFGWDGAADSLWMQSLRPILDPREMGSNAVAVARLLRDDKALACGYRRAFGETPGADDERLLVDAAKALAAFQETLVTPRTAFDDFRDAVVGGDRVAAQRYPLAAQRGLKVFLRSTCAACHFGPLFSNGEFGDTGIPFFLRPGEVDSGRHGGIARLNGSPFNRLGRYSDDHGASAMRTRHVEAQHRNFGEFRVPGLRQVGRTGPYMHDGSLATLEEVVKHYSTVSPDRLHSDGVPLVRPLGLTPQDSADLITFLRTLDAIPPGLLLLLPPPLCP
ncbi:MAG TPA: cytochrome c peroxidase [Reyranella sp.]|nr:cytochrome c peroxidase [Reyranella sp.]